MSHKREIDIATTKGKRSVMAEVYGAWAVHECASLDLDAPWRLTHVRSGVAVRMPDDVCARVCAKRLTREGINLDDVAWASQDFAHPDLPLIQAIIAETQVELYE